MRSQHIWIEKEEDGRKRQVRATKFGGAWKFQSKTAGELKWTHHRDPLLKDLMALREILVRKYHRRRAAIEDVAAIEKLIHQAKTPAEAAANWHERLGHRKAD